MAGQNGAIGLNALQNVDLGQNPELELVPHQSNQGPGYLARGKVQKVRRVRRRHAKVNEIGV